MDKLICLRDICYIEDLEWLCGAKDIADIQQRHNHQTPYSRSVLDKHCLDLYIPHREQPYTERGLGENGPSASLEAGILRAGCTRYCGRHRSKSMDSCIEAGMISCLDQDAHHNTCKHHTLHVGQSTHVGHNHHQGLLHSDTNTIKVMTSHAKYGHSAELDKTQCNSTHLNDKPDRTKCISTDHSDEPDRTQCNNTHHNDGLERSQCNDNCNDLPKTAYHKFSQVNTHLQDIKASDAHPSPKEWHPPRSPVVVFVHGGGWKRGDRRAWRHYLSLYDTNVLVAFLLALFRQYTLVGNTFAASGYACAVISYPLVVPNWPYMLIDDFSSFIMSTAFLGLFIIICIVLPTSLALSCPSVLVRTCAEVLHTWILKGHPHMVSMKQVFTIIAWTQIITWLIMCVLHKHYQLTRNMTLVVSSTLLLLYLASLPNSAITTNQVLWFDLLTIGLVQGIIVYQQVSQLNRCTYHQQIDAVTKSIQWVKRFGHVTGLYDSDWLFLMGHSAGGHLVSMISLDQTNLQNEGLSQNDIKVSQQQKNMFMRNHDLVYTNVH